MRQRITVTVVLNNATEADLIKLYEQDPRWTETDSGEGHTEFTRYGKYKEVQHDYFKEV